MIQFISVRALDLGDQTGGQLQLDLGAVGDLGL